MFKLILKAGVALLLSGAPVLAQPAALPIAPATRPAPVPQTVQGDATRVLVLPFNALVGSDRSWVGKAIQQDLYTDLLQRTRARLEAPQLASPPADWPAALETGRNAGAGIVIFGSFQAVGSEMRVTGQVVDVASGRALGGLKATGPVDDLFPLEDALGMQALHALPADLRLAPLAAAHAATQPATAPAQAAVPGPEYYSVQVPWEPSSGAASNVPPYISYTYPDSSIYPYAYYGSSPYAYSYGYPYFYYTTPFYGPDLFYFSNIDRFHHHRGFDHDRDDFHRRDWNRFSRPGFQPGGIYHGRAGGFTHSPAARPMPRGFFNRGGIGGFRGGMSRGGMSHAGGAGHIGEGSHGR